MAMSASTSGLRLPACHTRQRTVGFASRSGIATRAGMWSRNVAALDAGAVVIERPVETQAISSSAFDARSVVVRAG